MRRLARDAWFGIMARKSGQVGKQVVGVYKVVSVKRSTNSTAHHPICLSLRWEVTLLLGKVKINFASVKATVFWGKHRRLVHAHREVGFLNFPLWTVGCVTSSILQFFFFNLPLFEKWFGPAGQQGDTIQELDLKFCYLCATSYKRTQVEPVQSDRWFM